MKRPRGETPRLLDHWRDVTSRMQSHRHVAIFLDFDGTLVRLAPRPEQVQLARPMRRILLQLARHPRVTLAVISGRRRAELLQHLDLPGIHYFGVYGWEGSKHSALPKSSLVALRHLEALLEARFARLPGFWIERKYFSVSAHLLAVPAGLQEVTRRQIRSELKAFAHTLRLIENLRDVEIVPRMIADKGVAVRKLLSTSKLRGAFPFYFGDDVSDEVAFVATRKGISIRVGDPRPTEAQFSAKDPAEVARILAKVYAAIEKVRSY